MKRVVLYARVSSDEQANNTSLDDQIAACRAYASERGYLVLAEFREVFTGASLERPELDRLRSMLDSFDVIVVRELDRFARKLAYVTILEDEFKKAGVEVEYVLGYEDSPEGRMMKNMQGAIREYERELIFTRMQRGRQRRAKSGKVLVGARPPYGYRLVGDQLVIQAEEAEIVRLIFHWYVYGDERGKLLTTYSIAQRLTEMKVPTYMNTRKLVATSGVWDDSVVGRILRNETYAGQWHFNKRYNNREERQKPVEEWIPVEVPAIIDADTFEIAAHYRYLNKLKSQRNTRLEYLLKGHLICDTCGYYFRCVGGTAYRCEGQEKRHGKTCSGVIQRDEVEARVWTRFVDALKQPSLLISSANRRKKSRENEQEQINTALVAIKAKQDKLSEKQSRLVDLYLNSSVDRDTLDTRQQRIATERARLDREAGGLLARRQALTQEPMIDPSALFELCQRYAERIDHFTFEERREALDIFGVQVKLKRGKPGHYRLSMTGFFPFETLTISRDGYKVNWTLTA